MSRDQITGEPLGNKYARYVAEIDLYAKEAQTWLPRAEKIVKRYRDRRTARDENAARFNILWSNIQTLLPALYSRNPKPDFQRRFMDADPVGRVACEILERANSYTLEKVDFESVMRQCTMDRLLCGRGTLWVRYVPHFSASTMLANEGPQIDDDAQAGEDTRGESAQELEYEQVDLDYVHWTDFGHNVARVWREVYIVWRSCYLTREELIERFGEEIGRVVPLDHKAANDKGNGGDESAQKAKIYEMWDRRTRRAVWLSKSYQHGLLDELNDPLGLENFFPCPRPLLPNMANDSVIPDPDYAMYQDQAQELDALTGRIRSLTKAIKVVGVRDASQQALSRIFSEGLENDLVPVESWAAFAEKGGIKGAIELVPMQEIVQTLLSLYDARERVKAELYEITGMADIIRGASDPNETYGAQQIKANFAAIRLEDMQREVQRFARDAVALIAEVHANHFEIRTLAEISGYALLTEDEKHIAQQIVQLGGTLPEDIAKAFTEPTWEEVGRLIDDANMRHYRLDIETDSTIRMDQAQEKGERIEFLTAVSTFMQQAMQEGTDPILLPLLGEMMMFAVRAFPIGKTLESEFNETIGNLRKQAKAQAGQQKPNPAMTKIEGEIQIARAKLQGEMALQKEKQQGDMQVAEARLEARAQAQAQDRQLQAQLAEAQRHAQMAADDNQAQISAALEQMKIRHEMTLEQMRLQAQEQLQVILAHLNNRARVAVAEVAAGATLNAAQLSAADQATGEI